MASEWERVRRAQQREAERAQRARIAAQKAADQEHRRQHVVQRKSEAERRTSTLANRMGVLGSILRNGLRRSAQLPPGGIKRDTSVPPFKPGNLGRPLAQPEWDQFSPPEPGMLGSLFGGRARHERQVAQAREEFEQSHRAWQVGEESRQQRLASARRAHAAKAFKTLAEAEACNREVDRVAWRVGARDREAVRAYLQRVVAAVPLPADFPRSADVTYSPRGEQAVVQVELPGRDVVPKIRGYRYVQTRDELQELPRPTKEIAAAYRSVVAQVALLYVRDLFDSDPALSSVAFNGHVRAIDPGTGQAAYPCLISLDVDRSTFDGLVLDNVTPEACLRRLNALVSPHPYELEPVTPVVVFDLTQFSFVDGLDAVSSLDGRPDLMDLSPTEFEHLVRQIFEAMGTVESWTTEQNYDDGIDAVIVNRDPLLGRLSVVQAKRYKSAIGPNHIRELAGSIEEKKAGHGILVTTSWFTPRSREKAQEHGRIRLIDGQNLVALIKQHLGKEVLISVTSPKAARDGDRSSA